MKSLKGSQNHIKLKSRLYLHCNTCNGIFLYTGAATINPKFVTVNCIHCGDKVRHIDTKDEIEVTGAIRRFAAVVKMEPSLQNALTYIAGQKKGVTKKVLLKILVEKSIHQLLYLGLITETDSGEIHYHLTIKGRRVLSAC